MTVAPRAAGPRASALRARPRASALRARPRASALRARPRASALRARPRAPLLLARARPSALRARPRRAVALLAVLGVAAGLGSALLLGADSAPAPAEPGIVPLRISSGQGIATGFAVADGRVVTVAHVLDGPVTVAGRRVRVIRVDRLNDLALLSAPGVGAGSSEPDAAAPDVGATRLDFARAADGEHLRVVRLRAGRRSSLSVHVERSIVAHVRAPGAARARVRPALELSVAGLSAADPSAADPPGHVASGDSGAAVITDSGRLAGIVFATSRNRADTAYAVDASRLRHLLR